MPSIAAIQHRSRRCCRALEGVDINMGDLLKLATGGLYDPNKKKQLGSAQRQARKVGAKVGKASEKARMASEREFATPSVSNILGGTAGPGLGSSTQNYRRRPLKGSR